MARYIEVSSTDFKLFIQHMLDLGKLGAKQDSTCPAFKIGPQYSARVFIEDDSEVVYTPTLRKGKEVILKEKEEKEPLTREQLEAMSLAAVRKATGIKEGGKEEIIQKYLAKGAEQE